MGVRAAGADRRGGRLARHHTRPLAAHPGGDHRVPRLQFVMHVPATAENGAHLHPGQGARAAEEGTRAAEEGACFALNGIPEAC